MEVLSGFNLLFTVIVLRIHNHDPEDPIPALLKYICCKREETKENLSKENKNPWHKLAQTVDYVLFTLTLLFVTTLTVLLAIFYVDMSGNSASTMSEQFEKFMQEWNKKFDS